MTTISLCMIVKDEEDCLARCLNSVKKYADEIIIVDTGSTDRTREIAATYTGKVYDFHWNGSFADARNFSITKAGKEWILVLDADEVMQEADCQRLVDILESTSYDAFFLTQYNYTNDSTKSGWIPLEAEQAKKIGYRGCIPNPVIRVFRNHRNICFSGVVHEVVDESVDPLKCKVLDLPIHHYWEEIDRTRKQMLYLEITEKELKKHPSGRLHAIAAAINYNFKQDYTKALQHFEAAAASGYKTNSMSESAAECYLRLEDYAAAYEAYQRLVQSGHRTTAVCSNLANLMVRRGEYQSAIELLEFALSNTNNPGVQEQLRHHVQVARQFMDQNA